MVIPQIVTTFQNVDNFKKKSKKKSDLSSAHACHVEIIIMNEYFISDYHDYGIV